MKGNQMKIHLGFISNSSAASFILVPKNHECAEKIIHFLRSEMESDNGLGIEYVIEAGRIRGFIRSDYMGTSAGLECPKWYKEARISEIGDQGINFSLELDLTMHEDPIRLLEHGKFVTYRLDLPRNQWSKE
jgi:hypothetical protein